METPKPVITFFVPCLNEEGNAGHTIDTIVEVMKKKALPYAIIVIDDASVDGTVGEIRQCQKQYPCVDIRLIVNRFTRGLGRNYFIAAHHAQSEYFMIVNGDSSEPPEMIDTIVSRLGEADAIIPYFGTGETRTLPRRIVSQCFTFVVCLLSGHHLRYYNGPVLHKTENVQMWFSKTSGFGYQAELLCRLLGEGISYIEVQVTNSDRERGISKAFRPGNFLAVANSLFHIFLRRIQQEMISWRGRHLAWRLARRKRR